MNNLHCCNHMRERISYKCPQHSNIFDCPDNLVYYNNKFDEYGLIIHNGGQSYVKIEYCPWCGKKLPDSKRDLWFEELKKQGIENPLEDNIPKRFNSDKWWNNKK